MLPASAYNLEGSALKNDKYNLFNKTYKLFIPAGDTENPICNKSAVHFPQAAKKKMNEQRRRKILKTMDNTITMAGLGKEALRSGPVLLWEGIENKFKQANSTMAKTQKGCLVPFKQNYVQNT